MPALLPLMLERRFAIYTCYRAGVDDASCFAERYAS